MTSKISLRKLIPGLRMSQVSMMDFYTRLLCHMSIKEVSIVGLYGKTIYTRNIQDFFAKIYMRGFASRSL